MAAAALKTRNDRLGCIHARGEFGLGKLRPSAGRDDTAREFELRAKLAICLPIVRIPAPLLIPSTTFAVSNSQFDPEPGPVVYGEHAVIDLLGRIDQRAAPVHFAPL